MHTLYFDGARKGRDGRAGAGFLIFDDRGHEVVRGNRNLTHIRGITSNVCEYKGLIAGLKCADSLDIRHLLVKGDSRLVIEQVFGTWRINAPHLRILATEARSLLNNKWTEGKWIPRDQNVFADDLANKGCRNDIVPGQKEEWWVS